MFANKNAICQVKSLDKLIIKFYNIGRMNKIEFMRLWDLYNGLLTPTQQEITSMYFNLDLTVSEISEQKGVSRQAVSECLATCKKQLDEYERVLKHSEMLTKADLATSYLLTDVQRWADSFLQKHPEYAADIADLRAVLQADYDSMAQADIKKESV